MIKGWHKLSLVDYPEHLCTIIFLGGCNFRCSYCHNSEIAFNPERLADIKLENILDYLEKRRGYLDGVCISGGEPTIHPGLLYLMGEIKSRGFKVKLDTNGTHPEIIEEAIQKKLVDYIAMDVKAPRYKYHQVSGVERNHLNLDAIQESIRIIRKGRVDYEFRTTIVSGILAKEDIMEIGCWLDGSARYVLQPCRKEGGSVSVENLGEYVRGLSRHFKEIKVR